MTLGVAGPAEHFIATGWTCHDSALVSTRLDAIKRVAVHPQLARVELSLIGFTLAESATWPAMLIWAFGLGSFFALMGGGVLGLSPVRTNL